MKAALVIDEASLLRLEVFAELHTLTQFEQIVSPHRAGRPEQPGGQYALLQLSPLGLTGWWPRPTFRGATRK